MSELAQRIKGLSSEELKALVTKLKGQRPSGDGAAAGPQRTGTRSRFPLSFAQQRLWFLYRYEPESAAYNLHGAARLRGSLDVAALDRAISLLVERHEILRTRFGEDAEEAYQAVLPPSGAALAVTDLSTMDPAERERELAVRCAEIAHAPFALERGELLRTALFRLTAEEHVLLMATHHIASDHWTFGVLLRDLGALYDELVAGRAPRLPELPIRYGDYAVWQRSQRGQERHQRALAYWKERLHGAPALLELPLDRPRPASQAHRGAKASLTLSPRLSAAVKALCQREGVTLFMALLAAYQLLLCRVTQKLDVVVGSPVAGRTRRELEPLAGMFVNNLALRADLSDNPSFVELLRRTKRDALDAFAHDDLPFELLVEALQPERSTSHAALFQTLFIQQTAAADLPAFTGLTLDPVEVPVTTSKFDWTVEAWDRPQGIRLDLEYDTDLFRRETADRVLRSYEALLRAAAARPDARVLHLPVVHEDDALLLERWNRTERPFPEDLCVHELFERQARRHPERVALAFGDNEITYGELDRASARLARRLRVMGVGPDVPVAICMERSIDLVIGLLAILRSGGAYVPLDPALPGERIAYILRDVGAAVLLTQRTLRLPLAGEPQRTAFFEDLTADSGLAEEPLAAPPRSRDLAYVIYTSGSTGHPKGVQVEHRSVVNFLEAMRDEPGLDASDVMLSVTTASFDIFVLELFLPLSTGGTTVLVSAAEARDGAALLRALESSRATVMQATPSTWRLLLAAGWTGSPHLRAISGGEALPPDLARELTARVRILWNLYGPTETTVWSAAARVDDPDEITLGAPIANTRIYILDERRERLPIGVAGELYIGGAGLARGYHGRPDLTRERFLDDPFSAAPGARMYRTGDLARITQEGQIEFFGRIDHQVKIRGFRVELGEIEATVARHPGVRECVCAAHRDAVGEAVLVAYYVSATGHAPAAERVSPEALRAHARAFLPEAMLPARFVELPRLPQTPNGKIDRKALPSPDALACTPARDRQEPATEMERLVAAVWGELLGRAPGRTDNFFELGGHSLLAMRVVSRIRERAGAEVPLRWLFDAPMLADLAQRIEQIARPSTRPALRRRDPGAVIPLSYAQTRLWFLDRLAPGTGAYNVGGAAEIAGPLCARSLERAVHAVIERHEALRTVFRVVDGAPVQIVQPSAQLDFEEIDHRALAPDAREATALARLRRMAGRPFDLARGPLVRAELARIDDERYLFAFAMHHIVTDGWSHEIFVRELAAAYGAISAGERPRWEALPVQHGDHAVHERQRWDEAARGEEIAFWKAELAGASQTLDLPTDHTRPAEKRYQGARHHFRLSRALTEAVEDLGRERGVTQFMTLMAGFLALLHRLSGQSDLLVGTPIAGRDHRELEGVIGCFVNTLVFRGDLRDDPPFSALLTRVRGTAVRVFAHADIPFERLVNAVRPERDLGRTPLFQVMFAFQPKVPAPVALGRARVTPIDLDPGTSQYDITLSMQHDGATLSGHIEYDTALFREGTIARYAELFERLLAEAAREPDTRLSALLRGEALPSATAAAARPALSAPALPFVRSDPAVAPPRLVRHARRVDAELLRGLEARAALLGVSPGAAVAAAFAQTIAAWSTSPLAVIVSAPGETPDGALSISLGAGSGQLEVSRGGEAPFVDVARSFDEVIAIAASGTRAPDGGVRHPGATAVRLRVPAPLRSEQGGSEPQAPCIEHEIQQDERGFVLSSGFADDLFPEGLASDLLEAYEALLNRLSRGDAPWTRAAIIELPERQRAVRAGVNNTTREVSSDLLHSGFMRQAALRPSAPAVISPERTLTYGELDRQSSALARRLRALGARPNAPVAVAAAKGWAQIVALFAALKSGAAYLPIDPEWPMERIRTTLDQGQVEIVLTQARLASSLAWPEALRLIAVDDESAFASEDDSPVEVVQGPDDLAYVLFTSGSTGKPKGVALDHRGPLNTILEINERFQISASDRALALSAVHFDLSVYDVFGLLGAGGALVIPSPQGARDPAYFRRLVETHRVTVWNSVPALIQMLVEHLGGAPPAYPSLRWVILSGDWIPVSLPDQIRRACPEARVIGAGGPTETSIWSIFYPIGEVDPTWKSIPYGKPLRNQRVHVLDERMQPCPDWVVGRMYVGGICLARGYYRDPAQTAERFLEHPETGERLYWTGDLGRFLPDGNIEFIGREDFQVKIQGNRIELGEIEAALAQHPEVQRAVVCVESTPSGARRLVACYVAERGAALDPRVLEDAVAARLPQYMVPGAWVALERMPLTANGKVDRRALLDLALQHRQGASAAYRAPSSEAERRMAALWAAVLKLDRVGVDDNFFALGGDSLLGIALVERAREAGLDVTPRQLFQHQTVARLVTACAAPDRAEEGAEREIGERPLTALQRWYLEEARERTRPARWNVNLLLEALAPLDLDRLARASLILVNHHDALRARFERAPSGCRQVIDEPWTEAPFTCVDLSSVPEDRRPAELERHCDRMQDEYELEHGRLFRIVFFRWDEQGRGRLWLNAHHLVVDWMSMMIAALDLQSIYDQLATASAPRLPPKGASPGRWTRALERWVEDEILPNERAYWLSLPWDEIDPLPADHPATRHLYTVASVRDHWASLPEQDAQVLLRDLPARFGVSTENALIAAVLRGVTAWTGRSWQDIMVLNSGRDLIPHRAELDASRTVGWLSAERVLVLRRSSEREPLAALLDTSRQIDRTPNGGHGYNLLRYLGGDARLSAELGRLRKRPGILFNYQGRVEPPAQGSILRVASESTGYDEAATNLRFNLFECHVLVRGGALTFRWRYSANVHAPATVQRVADDVIDDLRAIARACG
ncbi:amino acid adenylation domain-containing protein [Sorangium sp. So ce375]|uniref:amino acid adenylation domain-containing protein n=1 Tax=Sorangium sp. So ce375 TaxID=3133306 RepID=UPI003F5B8801